MAANATKTVEYAFATSGSNIATGTSLAASTRYNFTLIGVTIPETTSRNFKSVILEFYYRDAFTTAYNTSGWRMGITCGSNAASDADYTPVGIANTGDHETNFVMRDVTDYFNTNFGTSASQSCQASFAVATATSACIANISAKLYITYEYETSASRSIKTVRVPIQSASALLTAAAIEIGTGGTTPAPANQIPALDTFLPETNKTYQSTWFEMFANDAGAATTDFKVNYQINTDTVAPRCHLEQALSTGTFYHDIWLTKYNNGSGVITDAYTISSSAVSAFNAYSDLTSRFDTFGGLYYVTYEYDSTSASVMNSIILPLENITVVGGTAASNCSYIQKDFYVTEPNVALAQSGVLLYSQCPAGATLYIGAGSQTVRPYTLTALLNSGGHATTHRIDHNSGFSLSIGKNTFNLKAYVSTAGGVNSCGGFLYLNYTSNSASGGESCHNHTEIWHNSTPTSANSEYNILTSSQRTPNIISSDYYLNGVGFEINSRFANGNQTIVLDAEKLTGEYNGEGWLPIYTWAHSNDGELANYKQITDATDKFNIDSKHFDKLNIETSRIYHVWYFISTSFCSIRTYLTYHTNTFTVSGSFSNPLGAGENIQVDVYRVSDNYWSGSVLSTASGSFSALVMDNVYGYFASASQDSNHIGRSASAVAV
jgi:hypothetical protein